MVAVLTGDIINSRNEAVSLWLPLLKKVLSSLQPSSKYWEVYRGDSFQIEIPIENALLAAFQIKATIKQIQNIDVRIAIGIGDKEFEADEITASNGTAFVNSGHAFDHLIKKQTIAIRTPWEEVDELFNISLSLALLTMDHWTANSAEFVCISIEHPKLNQTGLGEMLNISQAGVSKRGKRSGFEEIMKLEQLYRKIINQKITS